MLEGYIGNWNKYPKDEVKIRVARPSILGPIDRWKKDTKLQLLTN